MKKYLYLILWPILWLAPVWAEEYDHRQILVGDYIRVEKWGENWFVVQAKFRNRYVRVVRQGEAKWVSYSRIANWKPSSFPPGRPFFHHSWVQVGDRIRFARGGNKWFTVQAKYKTTRVGIDWQGKRKWIKYGKLTQWTPRGIPTGPRDIVRICISPPEAVIRVGEKVTLRALSYNNKGRILTVNVRWKTSDPAKIDRRGTFTSPRPGRFSVVAYDSMSGKKSQISVQVVGRDQVADPPSVGTISIDQWVVVGSARGRGLRLRFRAYGPNLYRAHIFAVSHGDEYRQIASTRCTLGRPVQLRISFPYNTKYIEIRIYDRKGRVLARHRYST